MSDKQSTWKRNFILFALLMGIGAGVAFAVLRQNRGRAQAEGTREVEQTTPPNTQATPSQEANPTQQAALSEEGNPSQQAVSSQEPNSTQPTAPLPQTAQPKKIVKTDTEWREALSPEAYRVTRRKGTERAFTGEYWNNKKQGVYTCVCCDQPLFDSQTKYKSGTGWPSFYAPIKAANVGEESDRSFFMVRTEVHCSRCDAHLGHVFDDGPDPTGLRYCINSVSLKFIEQEEEAEKK